MLVNPLLTILWRAKPSSAKDPKYSAVETTLPVGAKWGGPSVVVPRLSKNRGTGVIKFIILLPPAFFAVVSTVPSPAALSAIAAADLPLKEPPPTLAAPIGKHPVGKYPVGKYLE